MNRRGFVKHTALLAAAGMMPAAAAKCLPTQPNMIQVVQTDADFEREKLVRPFGFKGGYLTELWQAVSKLTARSGKSAIGLATQSVLYGDADLFAMHAESGGNALMYAVTQKALQLVKESPFTDPVQLLDSLLPRLKRAAIDITGKPDLNTNFVYNALVSVDNAAWLLYAAEHRLTRVDDMIPAPYRQALAHHNKKIAVMYQVPYNMPMSEVTEAAKQGYFVFKIKAGYPGTQQQMLQGDMDRLTQIHGTLKDLRTTQTPDGRFIYTLDANGRYEKKETLMRYLEHAKKIGALEQIQLLEEPLIETNEEHVLDTGVRVGADESVHTETDAIRRLEQGYTALVLKGIAKTLSQSMKIAKLAFERNVPCLCADLTVNPILIDWHKNLAARLAPFPGIGMGLMETNGDMNYCNWHNMMQYHPASGASWTQVQHGVFELNNDFYNSSGGIFQPSVHYNNLFTKAEQ